MRPGSFLRLFRRTDPRASDASSRDTQPASRDERRVSGRTPARGGAAVRSGPPYPVDLADPALVPLRREFAERFAHVCEGMDEATFARLIESMAVFRRRWGLSASASRHTPRHSRAAS